MNEVIVVYNKSTIRNKSNEIGQLMYFDLVTQKKNISNGFLTSAILVSLEVSLRVIYCLLESFVSFFSPS